MLGHYIYALSHRKINYSCSGLKHNDGKVFGWFCERSRARTHVSQTIHLKCKSCLEFKEKNTHPIEDLLLLKPKKPMN